MELTMQFRAIDMTCGHVFALPVDVHSEFLNNHKLFYCPICRTGNHYPQKSDAERLKDKLEAEEQRRYRFEREAEEERKKYTKIRDQVIAGKCPCCGEEVKGLLAHMKAKHPEEGFLRVLRQSLGLTQQQLADEIGVDHATYISKMENGKSTPEWVKNEVAAWLESLD